MHNVYAGVIHIRIAAKMGDRALPEEKPVLLASK